MNHMVVLQNQQALETRSWWCHHPGEADRMVAWLRNNHIQAQAYTLEGWNKLQAETGA